MPQLDPNTFLYQYSGVITLFVSIYVLLSYIVFPVLLRATFIRNAFLVHASMITSANSASVHSQLGTPMLLGSPFSLYTAETLSNFFTFLYRSINAFVKLIQAKNIRTQISSNSINKIRATTLIDYSTLYLSFYLITDIIDDTDNE